MKRRTFLTGMGGLAAAGMAGRLAADWQEHGWRSPVVIAGAASYQVDLEATIRGGLIELGFGPARIRGKSILLKPNLVEPYADAPQINTHPAVVRAAAEVFRGWGAGEVFVAEGPGHCRDAQLVLEQSGMETRLDGIAARVRRLESRRHRPDAQPVPIGRRSRTWPCRRP